jgi:hypothetical protein
MGASMSTLNPFIILAAIAAIPGPDLDYSTMTITELALDYSATACIFIIVGALMCAFAILAATFANYALDYIGATLPHYALNYFAEPDHEEMEPSWRENHARQRSASKAQSDVREKDRSSITFMLLCPIITCYAFYGSSISSHISIILALSLGALIGVTRYALDYYFAELDPDRAEMDLSWEDAVARESHALQESASKAQSDLREKDRFIQRQYEIVGSLEHRSVAHTRSIRGQLNLLKIKDSILVSKNRKIKYLENMMFEKDMHIRNLQWDFESLQKNVAWKDEALWVVTGSHSCAMQIIHNLQCNLGGCIRVLTWSDKSEAAAIDHLEKKYALLLGELSSKLDDAEKRLRKQTADAKELRAVIANDMPHYIECVKIKDVALRNAEALLRRSEAERKSLLDEKAISESQQLLEQAKNERNFANANRRLAVRHKEYFKLEKEHESNLQAALYERRGFEARIRNLENELSECKGRLTTVNTNILDREAQLAGALEAKADLETQLKASTQQADENSLHLGFAKNALDNAINQLKTLQGKIYSLQKELGEESRARETAEEGYVEVEGVDSGDEVHEDEDGVDGDDEDEDEDEEKDDEEEFENIEVLEGREPVEGEEGFEFVESE